MKCSGAWLAQTPRASSIDLRISVFDKGGPSGRYMPSGPGTAPGPRNPPSNIFWKLYEISTGVGTHAPAQLPGTPG
jgi:hypothetical protein